MIDIQTWLNQFEVEFEKTFWERIWIVGLQGSYGRGEATEQSDIDIVVILDTLGAEDLKAYEAMLNKLPHRDLICGFVSGKDELIKLVKPAEKPILMNAEKIKNGISVDFEEASETLFEWTKRLLLSNKY